jgi:hypothetical protein
VLVTESAPERVVTALTLSEPPKLEVPVAIRLFEKVQGPLAELVPEMLSGPEMLAVPETVRLFEKVQGPLAELVPEKETGPANELVPETASTPAMVAVPEKDAGPVKATPALCVVMPEMLSGPDMAAVPEIVIGPEKELVPVKVWLPIQVGEIAVEIAMTASIGMAAVATPATATRVAGLTGAAPLIVPAYVVTDVLLGRHQAE